jgi:hypothetical protein
MRRLLREGAFLSLLLSLSSHLMAQDERLNATPEDFNEMVRRTLIVTLLEEDPKVIEKMVRKKDGEEEVTHYRAEIARFNQLIGPAVRKYWTFDQPIEMRRASEVVELIERKAAGYVVLGIMRRRSLEMEVHENVEVSFPVLFLQRTDATPKHWKETILISVDRDYYLPSYLERKLNRAVDHFGHLPSFDHREEGLEEADLRFALVQMQDHMRWIMQAPRSVSYLDYASEQAEQNCGLLRERTLVVPKDQLWDDMPEAKAREYYGGDLVFVTASERDLAYMDKDPAKAIVMQIPVRISSQLRSAIYAKVVLDAATDKVLAVEEVKSMVTLQSMSHRINSSNLKGFADCDR